jgi:hypothetical protein
MQTHHEAQAAVDQVVVVLTWDTNDKLWVATSTALPEYRVRALKPRQARRPICKALKKRFPNATIAETMVLPEPDAAEYRAYHQARVATERITQQRKHLATSWQTRYRLSVNDCAQLLSVSPQRLALLLGPDVDEADELA